MSASPQYVPSPTPDLAKIQRALISVSDKDGLIAALLSAEITARVGRDPGEIYADLEGEFGVSAYERIDAPANADPNA